MGVAALLTVKELLAAMPGLQGARAAAMLPYLIAALEEFEINTPLRIAAFLAQVGHESGSLRWMEELASGEAYEGREDLGNIQPGDGRRYKGRGPIQLTGRANYRQAGKALGLDLEGHPEQASLPEVGFRIAGHFWQTRGLNKLADAGNLHMLTRRINGGLRGFDDRQKRYQLALVVLGVAG